MKDELKNKLVETLKREGYKITKERLLVFSLLTNIIHPISAKEIVKKLTQKKIDQVTVYRVLNTFKKLGIINQIDLQRECAYFELRDEKHDHHHIVCVECKKIEDFMGCDYENLIEKILKKSSNFVKITSHSFELFGICNSCAKINS